jgi:amino acid transporter
LSRTTAPAAPAHHEVDSLEPGRLHAWQATALAVALFGPAVGLSTGPALVGALAGNAAWLSVAIGLVACLCIALSVVAFARRYVVTGSLYSYASVVFGPSARVVVGVSLSLGLLVAAVYLPIGVGVYLGSLLQSAGVSGADGFGVQALIYGLVTVSAGAAAWRGLDTPVLVTVALTAISLPIALVVTVATVAHGGLQLGQQLSLTGFSWSGMLEGVAIGLAFFAGFETTTALAVETRNPNRAVPRIVLWTTVTIGLLYVLGTFAQVPALLASSRQLAAGASPLAVLADRAGLGSFSQIGDLTLGVTIYGTVVALYNALPRIVATLAEDGLMPSALARVDAHFRTPTTAIAAVTAVGLCGSVLVLAITRDTPLTILTYLSTLSVYGWVIPYVLICLGANLLLARERRFSPTLFATGLIGAALMVWLYVDGIVHPGPSPLNLMPYVFAGTLVIGLLCLRLASE